MNRRELIYDWNRVERQPAPLQVELDDETLRDGLQSPSAAQPTIGQKLEILHLMNELGINLADIGLPAASRTVRDDVERLAREIADAKLAIQAGCAARTLVADIEPIVEISQKVGLPIEVHAFIGSSPIRRYVENWDIQGMCDKTRESVEFSVSHGCPVMYVTEDTTRTDPATLTALINTAVEAGATRVCLCDTAGHATPEGVSSLIKFVRNDILGADHANVKIDWHGHSDRGLATINSLRALEAGAHRIHGTGLGMGERSGNAPMDQLLVNLKLLGHLDRDLTLLREYCQKVSEYCGITIPDSYPVVGRDAFRTGTGVHAKAISKSDDKAETVWLKDLVYSGVAASDYGLEQIIEIGPMSGRANVEYWFKKRGIEPPDYLVEKILATAKQADAMLIDNDIYEIIFNNFAAENLLQTNDSSL